MKPGGVLLEIAHSFSPPSHFCMCVPGLGALISLSAICYAPHWYFLKSCARLCASYGVLSGGHLSFQLWASALLTLVFDWTRP